MEKIVSSGEQDCTVELDGTECAVVFSSNYKCFTVQNETADDIYISVSPNISAGKDGVRRIGTGASGAIAHGAKNTLYILGSGSVQVTASDSPGNFFKPAPAAGGGEAVDAYSKTESDAKYAQKTDVIPYKMGMDIGTCATAAETIQKTATTLNKIAPTVGAVFAIKFTNAVPAQARLAVNGVSGYIQYLGSGLPAGIINAGDVVTFMYYISGGFNRFEIISVENGGKANTVGGVGIANLRQITQTVINTLPAVPNGEGDYLVNCNASDTSFPYPYGYLSIRYGSYTGEYVATFRTTGNDDKIYYNTYLTNHWSGWQEISVTPIKSTQISGTTSTTGNVQLWATTDKKIPVSAIMEDRYGYIFSSSNGFYYIGICHPDNHTMQVDETVSGTVYYIEKNTINVG
mgnify:CR=1 FL=1